MKLSWILSIACLLAFQSAWAIVTNIGNGIVYDNVNQTYWVQDLSLFSYKSYEEKMALIQDLNSPTSSYQTIATLDWHLATKSELAGLFGDADKPVWEHANDPYVWTPETQDYLGEVANAFLPAWEQDGLGIFYAMGIFDETFSGAHISVGLLYGPYFGSLVQPVGANYPLIDDAYRDLPYGAWVAASASTVPTPSVLFLLSLGLPFFGFSRWRNGVGLPKSSRVPLMAL